MASPALERQLNLLDYALSSIWRRKWKNGCVFGVFAAVIFLIASFQMITSTLTELAARFLAHSPDIIVQSMSAGRQRAIATADIGAIRSIFGVESVAPRVWGYYFSETTGANVTVIGLDRSAMPPVERLPLALDHGHLPEPGLSGDVVLGTGVRQALGLANRPMVSLFRPDLSLKTLRVSGVFADDTDILTSDLMLMSIADARDLFAVEPGFATDLCVSVRNPLEVDTVAGKIDRLLAGSRVLTRSQILKTYRVVFGWRSGFAAVCLLAVVAAFVILAWDKASGMSPEERREIAILKILGWQTADVLTVRCWESLLIAGLAFAVGWTAAYVHVVFFDSLLFRPLLLGWSVIKPPLRLLPAIDLTDLLPVLALTVVPYMAATVVPAWRCAAVPADSVVSG